MFKKAVLLTLVSGSMIASSQAATLLFEDFETSNVSYTTSTPEFSDNGFDFFHRTDGSNMNASITYNNIQGSSYFAGMDLDGEGASLPLTMTFSNINIAGATNLEFSGLFAEDDASDGNNDWDASDSFLVEYRIDGGIYQNLFALANDGSTFNSAAFVDTDFNGIGDGAEITDTFTLFSQSIAGSGNSLDLRFTFALNAGDEDIAFDNITLSGDVSPVPVPAAVWFLLSGLAGFVGFSRRRA